MVLWILSQIILSVRGSNVIIPEKGGLNLFVTGNNFDIHLPKTTEEIGLKYILNAPTTADIEAEVNKLDTALKVYSDMTSHLKETRAATETIYVPDEDLNDIVTICEGINHTVGQFASLIATEYEGFQPYIKPTRVPSLVLPENTDEKQMTLTISINTVLKVLTKVAYLFTSSAGVIEQLKLQAGGHDDVTDAILRKTLVSQRCETYGLAETYMRTGLNSLRSELANINGLYNGHISPNLLAQMDGLIGIPRGNFEKTVITNLEVNSDGVYALLELTTSTERITVSEVIPVPILGKDFYAQVQWPYAETVVRDVTTARIANLNNCRKAGSSVFDCPKSFSLESDECLEAMISKQVDRILTACEFQRYQLRPDPLIRALNAYTLIAQRSDQAMTIQVGQKSVVHDPVLITHKDELQIFHTPNLTRIPGRPSATDNSVGQFIYNSTTLNTILNGATSSNFYTDWLFTPYTRDVLLIILGMLNLVIILPLQTYLLNLRRLVLTHESRIRGGMMSRCRHTSCFSCLFSSSSGSSDEYEQGEQQPRKRRRIGRKSRLAKNVSFDDASAPERETLQRKNNFEVDIPLNRMAPMPNKTD